MDVVFRLSEVSFVWDARKAAANVRKHGIDFEEAAEAFLDPFVRHEGEQVVEGERRESLIGMTTSWRLLAVAFTFRSASFRIISARPATAHERRRYENQ